jgi:hypothetical protein
MEESSSKPVSKKKNQRRRGGSKNKKKKFAAQPPGEVVTAETTTTPTDKKVEVQEPTVVVEVASTSSHLEKSDHHNPTPAKCEKASAGKPSLPHLSPSPEGKDSATESDFWCDIHSVLRLFRMEVLLPPAGSWLDKVATNVWRRAAISVLALLTTGRHNASFGYELARMAMSAYVSMLMYMCRAVWTGICKLVVLWFSIFHKLICSLIVLVLARSPGGLGVIRSLNGHLSESYFSVPEPSTVPSPVSTTAAGA